MARVGHLRLVYDSKLGLPIKELRLIGLSSFGSWSAT